MTDRFSLAGRSAVVTGASRGIGQAIAMELAEAGAAVTLAGRAGSSTDTARMLESNGHSVHVVDLDLCDTGALRASAEALADEREIDILINNAGVIDRGPSLDVTHSAWRSVLDVNLDAPFLLCQTFGKRMITRGRGKIINVASLLSFQGGLRVASYAASKHGLQGLTQALSNEWAHRGVQVNAIAPGYIATDNTADLRSDDERSAEILSRIPTGRWGEATDIGGAAVFLASPAADYITGHTLVVDGGWMAR